MQPTHRICLLGPVLIQQDSQQPIHIRSRKALALFGYLAVQNAPVARSQLVSLLWSGLPEDRARANLSWTLHYLTSLLPDTLDVTYHSIGYCPTSQSWLNVVAFRRLAAQNDQASLAQAVALYRGVFLDGVDVNGGEEYELWLVGEREHWRLRVIDALYRLAALYEQECELTVAQETLWRLLELEPWAEAAHMRLMHLYAIAGLPADALLQYQRYRQLTQEEFGSERGVAIASLYECIRTGMYGGG